MQNTLPLITLFVLFSLALLAGFYVAKRLKQKEVMQATEIVADLKNQLSAVFIKADKLTLELESAKTSHHALELDHRSLLSNLQAVESHAKELAEKSADLELRYDRSRLSISDAQERLAVCESQNTTLLQAEERNKALNATLSGELARVQSALSDEKSSVAELRSRLSEKEALGLENHTLIDTQNTELRQLRQAVEQVRTEKAQLSSRLAERDETCAKYKEIIDKSDIELRKLRQVETDLKTECAQISSRLEAREKSIEEIKVWDEQKQGQLVKEFENLSNRIFAEKSQTFSAANQQSIEHLLKPFREQIEGFQLRVNDIHSQSIKGNSDLSASIREVLNVGMKMSGEANNLASALKGDKKTVGGWGEVQLEKTLQLAGLVENDHYTREESLLDNDGKRKRPDFIIKLPGNKQVVVDSKVSLVDYERASSAESEEAAVLAYGAHVKAVRNHIDRLAEKDYSNLKGLNCPGFVLMFMPIEPAYIEAMKQDTGLYQYGYNKGVIPVSYTTLMPILRTVANLWVTERSNEEAREISEKAGEIYNKVRVVAAHLNKLGASLQTAGNQFNDTVASIAGKQGLYGKAERFEKLSSKVAQSLPVLEPRHIDIASEKLEAICLEMHAERREPEREASGRLATPL